MGITQASSSEPIVNPRTLEPFHLFSSPVRSNSVQLRLQLPPGDRRPLRGNAVGAAGSLSIEKKPSVPSLSQPLRRAKSKPPSSQQEQNGPSPNYGNVAGGSKTGLCTVKVRMGLGHLCAIRVSHKRPDVQRGSSQKSQTLWELLV